ncbi:N-acetylmuramoyl-L-alanine amidase [Oceanobacillus salinisoli]|uniref:N-acetylmuramoyl-L-alanine amidase n=1 Tax=Oceanobacillus salinisoli TaxID=2678611 RepID=UPI0012E16C4C|nr:N-acetylmuramoyl-L-alanine amidase [Oceanobacillus salinisoli]
MAFKVVVGAGHGGGGSTPGKRTPEGEFEWNFNDKVADAFVAELSKYDDVQILRVDDDDTTGGLEDVPLRNRVNEANRWGGDIYISFHHNAYTGSFGNWTGTETYYYKGSSEGKRLAEFVHDAMLRAYGLRDRGIKDGSHLYLIKNTNMPAVLTEGGFMDSRIDIEKLRNDQVLQNAGRYTAQAVAEYAGLKRSGGSGNNNNGTTEQATKVSAAPKSEVKSEVVTSAGSDNAGDVANIQATLNKRYNTNIKVDNIYGPNTQRALVRGYQTELNKQFNAGLTVDGIFGPRTKRATVTVSRGSRGNITWIIQATLTCKGYNTNGVDGIFGSGTENAVRQFQRDSGLSVDGIFGKNTAEALFTS